MKRIFFALLIACCWCSCSNNKKTDAASTSTTDTIPPVAVIDSFFPVTSFLKGQMLAFDTIPVTPLKIVYKGGKEDSIWVKREDLKALLEPFIKDEIGRANLLDFFKVTKFNDQTINALTFTYDPIKVLPDTMHIRHWNMYLNPETGSVTKIYIVKQLKEKDKTFTQQLTWQTNTSAKITTLLNSADGKVEIINDEKYVWAF